jgi:adenylate cyclase
MKRWHLTRKQRRLRQAAIVGLIVAGVVLAMQWGGLFASARDRAADYLYDTKGNPGDDIVIVAIDEPSLQALGDWPLSFDPYIRLFERLRGARVVGLDVLLPNAGPEGNRQAMELVQAIERMGNVIVPVAALELEAADPGELYKAGRVVYPFPALLQVATVGSVNQVLDRDGTVRRVPLLVDAGSGEVWEAFGLQILRRAFGLGGAPAALVDSRVVIGDGAEIQYEVPTDESGVMRINFVGRPNTFPSFSLIDVIEDRVPPDTFDDQIVLVGVMNALTEMDLHRTPFAAQRMAGVELQANVIHTLLNHRALVCQGQVSTALVVIVLALASAGVLSQLDAVAGALFTVLLALGYFLFSGIQFSRGCVPNVLSPYIAIVANYAAITATRFASERAERNQVADVFGRFVSFKVRDEIVDMALDDPELIRPGGRQIEISVLFADIRGFTSMSENLEPSAVVEILNRYLDSMEEQVFKLGGTLDKYTGDGMMVLFGAPLAQPDHAVRAVQAALSMQQAAAEVSSLRGDAEWQVAYGIGISTGPAVVGHIGSRRRLDYTAIGDTVNLAARLEGIAAPGTVLISQTTFESVRDQFLIEALGPARVKGKSEPVPVYKVLGLAPGKSDLSPDV